MPDVPPDRLCNDPRSPYFNEEALARDVGIRFKGVEKSNVEEYCVSERMDIGSRSATPRPVWQSANDQTDRECRALFQQQEAAMTS